MKFSVRSFEPGRGVQVQTLEAPTPELARLAAAGRGQVVLAVEPAGPVWEPLLARRPRLDVPWWCKELRTLLVAGMTVVEAVDTLAAQAQQPAQQHLLKALLAQLAAGKPLSQAMEHGEVFPDVLIAGVRAGERTGELAAVLDDYLRFESALSQLKRKVVTAAIYPAMVAGLGLVISLFLFIHVMPRFAQLYLDSRASLSGVSGFIVGAGVWVAEHKAWVLPGLAALGLLAVGALAQAEVRRLLVQAVLRLGPVGQVWQHFRLAKLYQGLAMLVRGGYTLDAGIELCQRLGLGPQLNAGLRQARAEVAAGKRVSLAFRAHALADETAFRLIAVGERAGNFHLVLDAIAQRHTERFSTGIERITRIAEPLMLLLVALVVGGLVVAMYMPVFDLAASIR